VNIATVNLNLLVALDALLIERHVTRAAKRIGITQSAMSNALSRLRELFDDPLFVRHARGITPTARAIALERPLRDGLARLQSTLEPDTFDPRTAERTFVVAVSDYVELVLLGPLLHRLAREAPGVRIELRAWGRHEVPDLLARGEADLAIGYFDSVPESHAHLRIFEERFVCLVRRAHPRVKSRLTLKTWVAIPHIVVSERSGATSIDRALAKRGLTRTVGARVSHFLMVPSLVAATDLIAAVDSRVAAQFAKPLGLRVLPMPLHLPASRVAMVWHDRLEADRGHGWLRATIAEVARRV
jgi:DNA-binding transcriptional LysR family regulator